MLENCRNVCVIGAGTMGSGIAAHLANIGFDVTLLDLTHDSVKAAFDRAKSARPPHFYLPGTAETVRLGSIQDDLHLVSEADWVCEAIIEKLDAKRELFEKIEPLLKPDALVSTNTSGLQISLLCEGRSESFKKRFLGTHFFNPPRYLKLLELIPTPETAPGTVAAATRFLEDHCARRVVTVKDTPGFIANRFGMWSMFHAVHCAEKLGLTVEQVDAITGPFLGRPKTGSFRLNDLVGLDIMLDIASNLIERCPHDPQTKQLSTPASLAYLVEKGWIGGKAGQGYYRKEGNQFLAFDLTTKAYREVQEPGLATLGELGKLPIGERLRTALQGKDEVGEFLRLYLVPTLAYANAIKEEISFNVRDFDRVMRWGFGWDYGPFELIDAIGAENLGLDQQPNYDGAQVRAFSGEMFTPEPEPSFRTVTDFPVVSTHRGFKLRDLGDNVHAVSLTTKMGVVTPDVVDDLTDLLAAGKIKRLVLTSEAKVYSVGFDLGFFVDRIEAGDFLGIEQAIARFQNLNLQLAKIPSVAAVFGYCLGGGYEMATWCCQICAAPETQIGLPEAHVGLVPGGAGTVSMRLKNQDGGAKALVDVAKTIATATLSSNADHARQLGYLQRSDTTVYQADALLMEAKAAVLKIEPSPRPAWAEISGPFYGMIDRMQQELQAKGGFSSFDNTISDKVKTVFSKAGSVEDAVALEREGFVALCHEGLALARMKHMLEVGKPLRN